MQFFDLVFKFFIHFFSHFISTIFFLTMLQSHWQSLSFKKCFTFKVLNFSYSREEKKKTEYTITIFVVVHSQSVIGYKVTNNKRKFKLLKSLESNFFEQFFRQLHIFQKKRLCIQCLSRLP